MSYRKSHIKNKLHKIRPKKSVFKKLWFWIVALFFIIIFSACYSALFYSGVQLKNIIISGNEKAKTQDLQELAWKDASTGLINFLNIRINSLSILLVNNGKIDKDILERFPVVEKVTVTKIFPQTLVLDVAERKPLGIFCDNTTRCFFIDGSGVVFQNISPDLLNLDYTIVRQTTKSSQVFTGEEVVSQSIISAIAEIQKTLKDNFQINLNEALIASPVRLNVTTGENWQIYFGLGAGSDINAQLTELSLLLNGGISKDSRKNLRYIDLRPNGRAIVCDNSTCGGK